MPFGVREGDFHFGRQQPFFRFDGRSLAYACDYGVSVDLHGERIGLLPFRVRSNRR